MAKPELISSAANPMLKEVRRAIARGSLTEGGLCVAESFHLLEEALGSKCEVRVVLAAESARAKVETRLRRVQDVRIAVLPDSLFQRLSSTESAQGVIALVRPPEWRLEQLFCGVSLVVVLDGVQDPGNAGAIVRAAEAFGATGVAFLKGAVSPFNTKTLRASAGSLFRVPYAHSIDAAPLLAAFQQRGLDVYAAVPAGKPAPNGGLNTVDLRRGCAFLVGSEAHGVRETLRAAALDLSIPTVGVESLNVAVAAGILLYEARRQRSAAA